jgi:hypothetical protein
MTNAQSLDFGLETKVGPVIVSMPSGSKYAYVEAGRYAANTYYNGRAHINDNKPALVFRDQEYIGSARLYADEAGRWEWRPSFPGESFSRRPQWTNAPKTHQAAMIAAITEALAEAMATDPSIAQRADELHHARKVEQARQDVTKAEALVAEAKATLKTARKVLRDLEAKS